ncbi:hypothetical protein H0H87_002967 [Tephrocybe sp. NHM501043]|nr:hypothetical protein H0H87_002967 [Tephrocybe sp. NHM501043]
MPPDSTRTTSRRTQRKITEEELKDIELKRIKGELSRGCESICPCGILSAGQGTRFILADTDQLHKKIADMSHRIRQLEDALAILQATVSDRRHPLLQDELLKVKFGPEATEARQQSSPPSQVEEKLAQSIDALGTLTLRGSGGPKYFGRSAGSETLIAADEDSDEEDEEEAEPSTSTEATTSANQFFSPTTPVTMAYLESKLPPQERAHSLADSYIKHAANFFRPIKSDELFESFMPGIYQAAAARRADSEIPGSPDAWKGVSGSGVTKNSPHSLATLFFLFSLGALLDLSLPPYNSEAEHYYDLGRSALALRVVFGSPQIDTVQALGLMATYHCFAGKRFHRDSAWCVMSFAVKLAQGLGLHRDSARWGMDPQTVQKRRTLFWELFSADVSHSLALGRPPSMHMSYIDCEFPIDEEASLDNNGEVQNGFWRMKYCFARDLFISVADATLVAKSPDYQTILDIDRKVREIHFPSTFKPYATRQDGDELYYSSSHSLQGFYASQHRTVTMLYLHRSYFAQAMIDHPTNPLLSPFAPSFLTAFRSASVIIRATAHQFERCAEMGMRIIVGTVVTRSPSSDMSPGALEDLCRAVELFERTAVQSQRAKIALGVLHRLKDKALRAYSQHKSNKLVQPSSPANSLLLTPNVDDGDDDLAIFGGQTRMLSRKSRHRRVNPSNGGVSNSPSPPSSVSSTGPAEARELSPFTPPATALDFSPSHDTKMGSASSYQGNRNVLVPPSFTGIGSDGSPLNITGGDIGLSPPLTLSDIGNSPSQRPNDEAFVNFMGYMASKPAENPGLSSYQYAPRGPQGFSDLQEWRGNSPDQTGLPKPDSSFNWHPPSQPQLYHSQQSRQQQQQGAPGMFIPAASSQQSIPDTVMGTDLSPYREGHSFFTGYGQQPTSDEFNGSPNTNMVTEPERLFELGLMRSSDVDSGWVSYMQDCGIMDMGSRSFSSSTVPPS